MISTDPRGLRQETTGVELGEIPLYGVRVDRYYVVYKPITLSCILFMFIEIKFIHCHSCVMFAMIK